MMMRQVKTFVFAALLVVVMCAAGAGTVFADVTFVKDTGASREVPAINANLKADGAVQLAAGSTITATDVNSSSETVYTTETVSSYKTLSYYVKMPKKGMLAISYIGNQGSMYVSLYNGTTRISLATSATGENDVKSYYYDCAAGTYRLEVSLSPNTSGVSASGILEAQYAPAAGTVPTDNKVHCYGSTASASTSFKVSVPATGFLTLTMGDATGNNMSVRAKTTGFSSEEYFTSSSSTRWIGVKTGTYTFNVHSYGAYAVQIKFTKVSESNYGAKKSKAAKIKKKKTVKGVFITNKKKVHWYKFKNPKLQKVKLVFKSYMTGGGISVTVYTKTNKLYDSIYSGAYKKTLQPYTIGKGKKLVKGTYYVKVESTNKKGTGYFTMTWK